MGQYQSDSNTAAATTSFLSTVILAADNNSEDQTGTWIQEAIDATRWNQVYPYQLMVVQVQGDSYVPWTGTDGSSKWQFTLPFPPESITVNAPMAINGEVTLDGYVEERNGAPLKYIQFSGSCGVLPLRGTGTFRSGSVVNSIFAGTIGQAQLIARDAQNVGGDLTGSNTALKTNIVSTTQFSNNSQLAKTTGYYQMRLLQKFYENYGELTKTAQGNDLRLALCMWKDQSIYLVTPTGFTSSKNVSSPLEYTYNLSFRAHARISLNSVAASAESVYRPIAKSPDALSGSLQAILTARQLLMDSAGIISAIGADINKDLFEPMRQLTLFFKDALNGQLAFADLPVQVLNNCQQALVNFMSVQQAYNGFSDKAKSQAQAVVQAYKNVAATVSNYDQIRTGSAVINGDGTVSKVAAGPATSDGGGAPSPNQNLLMNAASMNVFRNPNSNYALFSAINFNQVQAPPTAVKQVAKERANIRTLKREDFEAMRDGFVQVLADFSDSVGAGNNIYNSTYGRAQVTSTRTPTASDYKVIFALNRLIMETNKLAVSSTINNNQISSVTYIAGLASAAGIAFKIPRSKFLIPFPYGSSLETLAARYLGDPDRWMEIAALNGLRAPWVDEIGFDIPLLTNGSGNQVVITDASNLFVNQTVWISSNTATRSQRTITNIRRVTNSNYVVTVDGDSNLSQYSTLAGASLHAFLPDTVNSMQMLYMPSDLAPPENDDQLKAIPGIDQFDQLLAVGGVDLLLDDDGDLIVTEDGDCRYAVGLANIIQTAKIRLKVPKGSLKRHRGFGIPIRPGQSVADISVSDLLVSVKNLFNDDPSFEGVPNASVVIKGGATAINMSIAIRGQAQTIPLTFNLTKS